MGEGEKYFHLVTTTPWSPAESSNNLKGLLKKVKKESDEAGVQLDIKKTKIMSQEKLHHFSIDSEGTETEILYTLI